MPLRMLIAAGLGALLVAALAAAAAVAGPPTTTDQTTTTEPVTTAPPVTTTVPPVTTTTTTVPPTTSPPTTAPPTTAHPTTNRPTTTQPPPRTSTAAPARRARPAARHRARRAARQPTLVRAASFGAGCPLAAVVLLLPQRGPLVVGPTTSRPGAAAAGRLDYPADGSVATASAIALREGGCTRRGPAPGSVRLESLSLFSGAVTARRIELSAAGRYDTRIIALRAARRPVAGAHAHVALGSWGILVTGTKAVVHVAPGRVAVGVLAVELRRPHAGLPAGSTVIVALTGVPAAVGRAGGPAALRRKLALRKHAPLKATPRLGGRHFVFPVVGPSDYIDTYGAFRGDVPGNWHHGDDIFAPLGTPVVAVADGTINRVGWERLGGWRVWVRDNARDEFYYAHLSGYAPHDLRSRRVKAGQVIGFVGNTGDAFTTSPHLHFEVHPHQLLRLGYDGAVNPTTYLDSWPRAHGVFVPRPTHPPLPTEPLIRRQASYVFRELLAARHLIRHGPSVRDRPRVHVPLGVNGLPHPLDLPKLEAAAGDVAGAGHSGVLVALLAGAGSLALAGVLLVPYAIARRRPRSTGTN